MPKNVPETPSAPDPVGPYSIAAEAAGLVFLSGQVAQTPGGGGRADSGVQEQAHQVMTNIGSILGDLGLGFADVVKTTVFLADIADYQAVNEVYASYFTGAPPARAAVQAGALPGGYKVEIEVVASR